MILNASPSLKPYNSSANPIDSVIKRNPAFNYFCLPPVRPPWCKPPPPCGWTLETVTTLPMPYTQLYDCGHSECFQVNQAGPLCGTPQWLLILRIKSTALTMTSRLRMLCGPWLSRWPPLPPPSSFLIVLQVHWPFCFSITKPSEVAIQDLYTCFSICLEHSAPHLPWLLPSLHQVSAPILPPISASPNCPI